MNSLGVPETELRSLCFATDDPLATTRVSPRDPMFDLQGGYASVWGSYHFRGPRASVSIARQSYFESAVSDKPNW